MADEARAVGGKRVLLIGGTGYVGEGMRVAFRDGGYTIRLLVRSHEEERSLGAQGFETALGDVLAPNTLVMAMDGVDAVVNLVAVVRENPPEVTFERINYQGSINVANAVRQAAVQRLIQMSALGADNLPEFPYHYTKWRAENYIKDLGLEWTVLRPSIIFGPSQAGYFQFLTQLADVVRRAPLIPVAGDGSSRFQPIHREDVATAFLRALDDPATIHQTYELAGPDVLTYREMLDEVARVLETGKPKVNVPIPLIRVGATVMEAVPFFESPVTTEQLKMLRIDNATENNAAPELIGRPLTPFHGNIDYVRG